MNTDDRINKILETDLAKLAMCQLKRTNQCLKTKLPSGTIIYEYDVIEVILMGWELISKIKQIRGLDI